eukprot:COSAG01_NODE_2784_length_7083_cov_306.080756_6_plen_986_part_01
MKGSICNFLQVTKEHGDDSGYGYQALASGGAAGHEMQLWNLQEVHSQQPAAILEGHTDKINGCDVSSDGHYALSASTDRSARFWDLKTKKDEKRELRTLLHDSGCNGCRMLEKGAIMKAVTTAKDITGWDLFSGEKLWTLAGFQSTVRQCISFAEDTKFVTCNHETAVIQIWDMGCAPARQRLTTENSRETEKSRESTSAVEHDAPLANLCVFRTTTDNLKLASCGYDNKIHVWDLANGKIDFTLPMTETVYQCINVDHLSATTIESETMMQPPTTTQLLACAGNEIVLWRLNWEKTTLKLPAKNDSEHRINFMDEKFHGLWNKKSQIRGIQMFKKDDAARTYVLACGGTEKLGNGCQQKAVLCVIGLDIDPSTGKVIGHELLCDLCKPQHVGGMHKQLVNACCVFAADKYALTASFDATTRLWELSSNQYQCLRVMKSPDGQKVRSVAAYCARDSEGWCPDTKFVSCGSSDVLSIWSQTRDPTSHKSRHQQEDDQPVQIKTGQQRIFQVALRSFNTHQGNRIVALTISSDDTLRVFDLLSRSEIVAGRRAIENPRTVVIPSGTVVDSTKLRYQMGRFPVLVGNGSGHIELLDLSNVTYGGSGSAWWDALEKSYKNKSVTNHQVRAQIAQWLVDTIQEDSPHLLYARDTRDIEHPTLIHKLAGHKDAANIGTDVLHKLILNLQTPFRAYVEAGLMRQVVSDRRMEIGLATVGLISRAGLARLSQSARDAKQMNQQKGCSMLCRRDAPTASLLRSTSKAVQAANRFTNTSTRRDSILHCHTLLMTALAGKNEGTAKLLLDDFYEHVKLLQNGGINEMPKPKLIDIPERELTKLFQLFPDLAADFLGKLPLVCTQRYDLSANLLKCNLANEPDQILVRCGSSDELQWQTAINQSHLKQKKQTISKRVPLVSVDSDTHPRENAKHGEVMPFSRLLRECVRYAEQDGPRIFDSVVLKIIVHHKWHGTCKVLYHCSLALYLIYYVVFIVTT